MLKKIKEMFFKEQAQIPREIPFAKSKGNYDIQQLALLAKDALQNQVIDEAFNRLEQEYFYMWKNSRPLETEARESTWHRLEALNEVRLELTGMVNEAAKEQEPQKSHDSPEGEVTGG